MRLKAIKPLRKSISSWGSVALLAAGLVCALELMVPAQTQTEDDPADNSNVDPLLDSDHPQLKIQDFSSQVTRDGQARQIITATSALLDEKDKVMTLSNVRGVFYDKGKRQGDMQCGRAVTWLKSRPKENIHAHDLVMDNKVTYRMKDGTTLQSPWMKYESSTSSIMSDQPFIKQIPLKSGYLVGHGDRFNIKLNIDEATFVSWQEYGKPAVLEKTSEPRIKP